MAAFLSLERAAEYCGLSIRTLRRAIKARVLAHHRPGLSERGKIFIRLTDLEHYIGKSRIEACI